MANFLSIPPLTATDGEKRFFSRIDQVFLNENHLIGYFEPYIGDLHPDFVLISLKYGVVVVEIKDYSGEYLKTITKSGKWERLKDDNTIPIKNPFDQLYQYWRAIKDRIEYCNFSEPIDIPITRIVGFSQISQDDYVAEQIKSVAPSKIHLCFKEVFDWNDKFTEFCNDIFPLNFKISYKQFELLRANIIPTCRLPTPQQANLLKYFSDGDKIKLLDQEQERMARELGAGHRLIFGVAGSGKTVLLIARARILAKRHPDWKILILCYNKLLKNLLFQLFNPQDYEANITVNTFHSWARNYILSANNEFTKIYNEAEKKAEKENIMTEFFQYFVPKIFMQMLKVLGENKVIYDAILIDEAQDFEKDWFLPIMQVLNPETNSLLITCDGLQGIYARKKFYWINVGIQAKGRVKRFEKSYRVPIEIGAIAQKTIPQNLIKLLDHFDEFISTKDFAGEHGTVEILISKNRQEEYLKLTEKVARYLKNPDEILILFKYNMAKRNYDLSFFDYLRKNNLQWRDLEDYNFETPGLLIGTLYGTKGLEADTIIIPELDKYKTNKDRQLLYVGMTRSRKRLILSGTGYTDLIKSLESEQV
ncbi:MAG: NERD domain-containing protein [Promethearchaeota archaeon]